MIIKRKIALTIDSEQTIITPGTFAVELDHEGILIPLRAATGFLKQRESASVIAHVHDDRLGYPSAELWTPQEAIDRLLGQQCFHEACAIALATKTRATYVDAIQPDNEHELLPDQPEDHGVPYAIFCRIPGDAVPANPTVRTGWYLHGTKDLTEIWDESTVLDTPADDDLWNGVHGPEMDLLKLVQEHAPQ